ncbi:hypothetical protein PC118_g24735, partial [Phytophthora cactorum]
MNIGMVSRLLSSSGTEHKMGEPAALPGAAFSGGSVWLDTMRVNTFVVMHLLVNKIVDTPPR